MGRSWGGRASRLEQSLEDQITSVGAFERARASRLEQSCETSVHSNERARLDSSSLWKTRSRAANETEFRGREASPLEARIRRRVRARVALRFCPKGALFVRYAVSARASRSAKSARPSGSVGARRVRSGFRGLLVEQIGTTCRRRFEVATHPPAVRPLGAFRRRRECEGTPHHSGTVTTRRSSRRVRISLVARHSLEGSGFL